MNDTFKKAALILAAAGFLAGAARAEVWPVNSPHDKRMQFVDYNPSDVTQINAVTGYITTITFAPGETVVNYGSGYSTAWEFSTAGNQFFLKPKAEQATTNLVVITDRRTYLFDVRLAWNQKKATYHLQFRYPDEEKAKAEALRQAAEEAAERKLLLEQPVIDTEAESPFGAVAGAETVPLEEGGFNWDYTMNFGKSDVSRSIAPTAVYDNGLYTVIRFRENADIPTIYRVLGSDGETLVNRHVDKTGAIVIRGVYHELRLRAGSGVVGIYNEAYGKLVKPLQNGTAVPDMTRELKAEVQYE